MPSTMREVIDLEATGLAPSRARGVVRSFAADLVPDEVLGTAELLVSELVTNAIRHGTGPVRLAIDCVNSHLSVTVCDGDPGVPRIQPERPLAESGRGLRMIDALAGEWGVSRCSTGPGKGVWFRLP